MAPLAPAPSPPLTRPEPTPNSPLGELQRGVQMKRSETRSSRGEGSREGMGESRRGERKELTQAPFRRGWRGGMRVRGGGGRRVEGGWDERAKGRG